MEDNWSENDVSDDNELTDSFNLVCSVKNIYMGRQSLTMDTNKKQKIYNIQKCLMNQVDANIDNIDQKFPDSFFRPTQINAQNFADIEKLMQLPFLNQEYIQFLPKELEGQFNFRFNRFSQPFFEPDWTVNERLSIGVCTIKKDKNNIETYDMEYVQATPKQLATQFKKQKGTCKLRSLVLKNDDFDRNIVLLHDFFQNPFSLIPIMNYFYDLELNVFVPYIADLTATVLGEQTDMMIEKMSKHLYNFVKQSVGVNIQYQTISQGTSAILALRLQKIDYNCLKSVVMNPIMRLRIKKNNLLSKLAAPSIIPKIQPSDLQSNSVESTSEHNCDAHTTSDHRNESQRESIQETKRQPNNLTFKYRTKSEKVIHNTYMQSNTMQVVPSEMNMKSYKLQNFKFIDSDEMIINDNNIQAPTIEDVFNKPNGQHGLCLVNDCLCGVYYDLNILQTLLNILGVKKVKDFVMVKSLDDFIKIYSEYKFETTRRNKFYQMLLSVHVFAPLDCFIGYNIYKETFDNYFFEMLQEMDYYILPQTFDFDGPMNVMFLIGSNASMMNKQQIFDILNVSEYYLNIESRIILGVGQEMFYGGVTLLEKIIKANG